MRDFLGFVVCTAALFLLAWAVLHCIETVMNIICEKHDKEEDND